MCYTECLQNNSTKSHKREKHPKQPDLKCKRSGVISLPILKENISLVFKISQLIPLFNKENTITE